MSNQKKSQAKTRIYPRAKIQLPIHYKFIEDGQQFHALESTSHDICATGVGAKCDRFLPSGQHLMMNLYIPKDIHSTDDKKRYLEEDCIPVLVLGELIWCEQVDDKDYFIGIKFHQIEDEHKNRLLKFLKAKNIYQYNAYYNEQ